VCWFWQKRLVPVFGYAEEVYCNSAFRTKVFKLVFDGMGTRLTHGPVFAPWSHEMAEFAVKMVMSLLRKWAASIKFERLSQWPNEVPRIVNRLNTRKIAAYGPPPSEMMLGWQTRCVGNILDEAGRTAIRAPLRSRE